MTTTATAQTALTAAYLVLREQEASVARVAAVDEAFHALAIKERNYERAQVDSLRASLAATQEALTAIGKLHTNRPRGALSRPMHKCVQCGFPWPCPTAALLPAADQEKDETP